MKLEVGKYYKTRDGRKAGPLLPAPLEEFPFKASRSGPWFTAMGEAEGDGRDEKLPNWDLISEWEESDTSCTKAGNTTVDLTAITTPFGLLDKATQDALRAHGGPWQYYTDYDGWRDCKWIGAWPYVPGTVYRVKPQPSTPREWWAGFVGTMHYGMWANEELAHKAMRDYGAYELVHVREVLE